MKLMLLLPLRTIWSEDDNAFVGLCDWFPSLSFVHENQQKAFDGIQELFWEVIEDMKNNNETLETSPETASGDGE